MQSLEPNVHAVHAHHVRNSQTNPIGSKKNSSYIPSVEVISMTVENGLRLWIIYIYIYMYIIYIAMIIKNHHELPMKRVVCGGFP